MSTSKPTSTSGNHVIALLPKPVKQHQRYQKDLSYDFEVMRKNGRAYNKPIMNFTSPWCFPVFMTSNEYTLKVQNQKIHEFEALKKLNQNDLPFSKELFQPKPTKAQFCNICSQTIQGEYLEHIRHPKHQSNFDKSELLEAVQNVAAEVQNQIYDRVLRSIPDVDMQNRHLSRTPSSVKEQPQQKNLSNSKVGQNENYDTAAIQTLSEESKRLSHQSSKKKVIMEKKTGVQVQESLFGKKEYSRSTLSVETRPSENYIENDLLKKGEKQTSIQMNRDKSDKSTEDGSAQDDFEKNKTSMKQINNSQVPWAEKAKKLKNSERSIKDVVLLNQEFEKKLKVTTNSQSKEEIRTVSKATHSRWNSIKSKFVSFFVDSFANWFSQPKTNTQ